MPIAFDAANINDTSGSSATVAHTCTGSNRILFVGVTITAGDILTGVTYNGVAMTLIAKNQEAASRWAYLFYLINPASGTNNVVVSLSSTATIETTAVSYTGALQSGQPDASLTNLTSGATSATNALTTLTDNCWMVSVCQCNLVGPPSPGTGITQRTPGGGNSNFGDSNGVIHPAGSYSMTWTQSGTENFNVIQASFKPALGTEEEGYLFSTNASLEQMKFYKKSVAEFMEKAKKKFNGAVDYVKDKSGIYVPDRKILLPNYAI